MVDEDILDVTLMFGLVRNHIREALQEIIATYIERKDVCEKLIKMLSLQAADAITDVVKDVGIMSQDEDVLSADEKDGIEYEIVLGDDPKDGIKYEIVLSDDTSSSSYKSIDSI